MSRLGEMAKENALVLLYAILIALCVVFMPTEVIEFIYAEF